MRAPTPRFYLGFGSTWTTLDSAISWTEITDYVMSERGAGGQRGRSSELDDMRAGTFNFTLDNSDRRFDPMHAAGPYFGDLKPGVPVKITGTANAVEYPVFRGFVNGWPQDYDVSNRLGIVNVQCTDGMAKLATAGTPSSVLELEIAADNPDAFWRLDEQAGTIAQDASGNGRDLTFYESIEGWTQTVPAPNGVGVAGILCTTTDQWGILVDSVLGSTVIEAMEAVAYYAEGELVSGSVNPPLAQLVGHRRSGSVFLSGMLVTRSAFGASIGDYYGTTHTFGTTKVGHHYAFRAPGGNNTNLRHYVDGVESTPTAPGVSMSDAGFIDVESTGSLTVGKGFTSDEDPCSFVVAQVALYLTAPSAARMQAHGLAWSAPWDGDTTGDRIDRILALAPAWPSDLIDTADGFTILGPASLGQNKLQLIKSYEKAEQGRFFISKNGKATFLDRYYNQLVTEGSASQATFSDDGSDNAYCSIAFDYDDRLVYNRVRASRTGGATIEVFDETSIETYGEQVDSSLSGIQVDTDALVRGVAELRLDRYKDPQLRVRPVELKLHGLTAAQQADVLGLELGYRVTVERTPQGVGSTISQETVVEGISHRLSGGAWTATLTLSPVDTREYGLWGDNWGDALWGY